MKHYIDKSAVVAEIEKRLKALNNDRDFNYIQIKELEALLSFLDTLEVKEINDDKWLIKATEWLSANLHRYDESIGLSADEFVERFKKAMGKPTAALLWHPADGDYLPEIDREVIVLLTNDMVCFAHRPNPNGWDGKSTTTGEVKHYTPKTYDKGGWNIPDVKFWLDLGLPNEE